MSSSREVAAAHSRTAHAARHHGRSSAEYLTANRDLNAALLKQRATEIVSRSAQRLTDAQIDAVLRIMRRPATIPVAAARDSDGNEPAP